MCTKSKLFSLCIIAAFSVLAASTCMAITCTDPIVRGNGTYTATIAVASNFFLPAQDLVTLFQDNTTVGADSAITVCHDATATLAAAITANPSTYGMFFAADTTAANFDNPPTTNAYSYARGIPVFFGLRSNVNSVSKLIPGLGNGYEATLSGSDLSSYSVNSGYASKVALANPALAPYGAAAFTILNAMGDLTYPPVPSPLPNWAYSSLFSNIANTYNAVIADDGNIKSGFVSKGQICNTLGDLSYVQFTNAAYTLDQQAVLLLTGNTAAAALDTYLRSIIGTATWNNFLSTRCYATP